MKNKIKIFVSKQQFKIYTEQKQQIPYQTRSVSKPNCKGSQQECINEKIDEEVPKNTLAVKVFDRWPVTKSSSILNIL